MTENEIGAALIELAIEVHRGWYPSFQSKKTNPKDLKVISDWPAIIGFRNILAHAKSRSP